MSLRIDLATNLSKPKKSILRLIWILLIVVGSVIGSTLAASITLNSGNDVEFGQGKLLATACDTEITLNPLSGYANGPSSQFVLKKIALDDIDSSVGRCKGVDFHIRFYPSDGAAAALTIYTDANNNAVKELIIYDDGTQFIEYVNAFTITSRSNTGFTLDLGNVILPVGGFDKITLETYPHVYRVGETGPADGVVFMYEPQGFACGPTLQKTCHNLEIAPAEWFGQVEDPILPWSVNAYKEILVPLLNGYGPATGPTGGDSDNAWTKGYGLSATLAIIAQNGPYDPVTNRYAAGAANAYRGGGYSDWHLPNFGEATQFNVIYGKLVGELGVDAIKEYWTSIECGAGGAYKIARDGSNTFYVGGCNDKYVFVHPMRPIHAF
jgi:hypothetical protein